MQVRDFMPRIRAGIDRQKGDPRNNHSYRAVRREEAKRLYRLRKRGQKS